MGFLNYLKVPCSTQLGPRLKRTIIKILTKKDNQNGGELELTNKQAIVNK